MSADWTQRFRRFLPWLVSIAALLYVFGWATNWDALIDATRNANLPLFIAVTFADKMLFFLGWTALQVAALRRLVGPLSVRSLISLRGGSELLRAVSNPLADGTFLLGLIHLTGGSSAMVLVAASIPAFAHTIVMLIQATVALPFLEGGIAANRDVVITVSVGWTIVIGLTLALRSVLASRWTILERLRAGIEQINIRQFLPIVWAFVPLAAFDVLIQGLATRAFGIPIDWSALAARIPVLYLALSLPSFGNFGTRELAWAGLFSAYGDRTGLIAYAFATNAVFLMINALIGVIFLPRAIQLIREVRRARRSGEMLEVPLFRDAGEP